MSDKMMDSGVAWIGQMPEDWSLMRLKDCLLICNGREVEADEGSIPVYGSGGAFKWTDRPLCKEPSILFGRKGTIDKPLYVNEPFWTVDTMFYSKNRGNVELEYLYLLATCFNYDYYLSGSTLPSMTQSDLGSILIPFPPRDEQRLISRKLKVATDDMDRIIAIAKKQIQTLEHYKKSLIHEAVTKGLDPDAPLKPSGIEWFESIPEHWDAGRLTSVAERHSGHTPNRETSEYWEGGDIVWVSLADSPSLRLNEYIDKSTYCTTQAGINHSSAEILPAGTVLLSRDATVGLTAIASCDLAVSQHFMAYICGENLLNKFLYYCFLDMEQPFKKMSAGSTIPTIGLNKIKTIKIPIPPIEEQKEIAIHLDEKCAKVDAILDIKRKQIEVLKKRRQSLIYEYVTGKRRVGEES